MWYSCTSIICGRVNSSGHCMLPTLKTTQVHFIWGGTSFSYGIIVAPPIYVVIFKVLDQSTLAMRNQICPLQLVKPLIQKAIYFQVFFSPTKLGKAKSCAHFKVLKHKNQARDLWGFMSFLYFSLFGKYFNFTVPLYVVRLHFHFMWYNCTSIIYGKITVLDQRTLAVRHSL